MNGHLFVLQWKILVKNFPFSIGKIIFLSINDTTNFYGGPFRFQGLCQLQDERSAMNTSNLMDWKITTLEA